MIQVQNTILSNDIFDECFVCDYDACKGICCVEGEGGAPVEKDEVDIIRGLLPALRPLLSPRAIEIIDQQGVSYVDEDGDEVTSIVDGKDCVFTTYDSQGRCQCAIERLYFQGETTFRKPISCHLYPIRLTRYPYFTALNYHRWEVCRRAIKLGNKQSVRIYRFLEEPLIRAFGKPWYKEVCEAATLYEQSKT